MCFQHATILNKLPLLIPYPEPAVFITAAQGSSYIAIKIKHNAE